MTTATVVIAALSLAVSLASIALSLVVMRQSGDTSALLQRHRLGHQKAHGKLDPAPHTDRRRINVGPPRATGERRASPGQLLPPEDTAPAALMPEDAPTGPARRLLPRPGEIGRPR